MSDFSIINPVRNAFSGIMRKRRNPRKIFHILISIDFIGMCKYQEKSTKCDGNGNLGPESIV